MRRSKPCFLDDTRGSSAVEFAIVVPVFLALVFGIIVYGYYFASLAMVNHIAYESARATVSGLTDDQRTTYAQTRAAQVIASLSGFIDASQVQVTAASTGTGTYAVTVRYHYDLKNLVGPQLIVPLPSSDQIATVEVSHGGY